MRARGRLDAQRSRAGAGRCSPEAHSPNHTVKMAFFVTLGFIRFVGESRPSSRRYPYPLSGAFGRCYANASR
jgi:hypothetical protein